MLFLFVCFLGFLLPNRTKTVSLPSVPIALISSLSLSFFIQERLRLNREQKTKQEQTCPLVEFASLPATANKGHLGQLVHLAQLHSARASPFSRVCKQPLLFSRVPLDLSQQVPESFYTSLFGVPSFPRGSHATYSSILPRSKKANFFVKKFLLD